MPRDNGSCLLKRAKRYSGIKYSLSILETLYLVALLFIFAGLGLSETLAQQLAKISSNNYLTLALYLLTTTLLVLLCCSFRALFYIIRSRLGISAVLLRKH